MKIQNGVYTKEVTKQFSTWTVVVIFYLNVSSSRSSRTVPLGLRVQLPRTVLEMRPLWCLYPILCLTSLIVSSQPSGTFPEYRRNSTSHTYTHVCEHIHPSSFPTLFVSVTTLPPNLVTKRQDHVQSIVDSSKFFISVVYCPFISSYRRRNRLQLNDRQTLNKGLRSCFVLWSIVSYSLSLTLVDTVENYLGPLLSSLQET